MAPETSSPTPTPAGRDALLPAPLDRASLVFAARALAAADPDLARIHRQQGPPPLWGRREGFGTLLRIILEQQVSLASARAAYERLQALCGGRVTPAGVLIRTDAELRAAGFSRQKAGYARDLARAVRAGRLDLASLRAEPDDAARSALLRQRGVGGWTADIYLVMALRRPDVWPSGDLALVTALRDLRSLPAQPDSEAVLEHAERWRPWRSVAARMLWQAYLVSRGRPVR